MTEEVLTPQVEDLKQKALIGYILYALSAVIPLASLGTLILAYIKRGDAAGTWVQSHFNWQIKTFWVSFIGTILGFVTIMIFIGYFILLAVAIYVIYRIVAGWLKLSENRPAYG